MARDPEWYEEAGTPDAYIWWWALEHNGHPCCYLRALMPGDFRPGARPLTRHVKYLDGVVPNDGESLVCGTCGEVPESKDLEPIERATGDRGHLAPFRSGTAPWAKPTDPQSCYQCSSRDKAADCEHEPKHDKSVKLKVCAGCSKHLKACEDAIARQEAKEARLRDKAEKVKSSKTERVEA